VNRQPTVNMGKLIIFIATALFLIANLLLSSPQIGWADDTTRVLVIPFTINAAKDLDYLKRGINDMLTSRLEKDQKVVVVTADGDKDDLKALAQKANADYVITGSVTILGDSVSTDAQVVKGPAPDVPVLSFNRTGGQQAKLIEHINELAAAINTRILGRRPKQPDQAATTAPAAAVPAPTTGGPVISPPAVTAAPTPSVPADQPAPAMRQPANPAEPRRLPGIGTIKGQACGISGGDVDGDGIVDIVTITTDHLFVHRLNAGRWVKLAEYDSLGDFIGVDTADLNGNGKQEIFVTQFIQNEHRAQSFVLEWDGKTLQRIAAQMPWYFRSVDLFRRGRVLVGQRQTQAKRFSSGIYEMKWTGDDYAAGDRLVVPRDLNSFGFALGAVRMADKPEVVTYSNNGYVQFLTPSGEETWVTTEHYGGGSNFIVFSDETQWDVQDYVYLAPRILLHDLDGDGIQEMLVVKNQHSFTGSGVLARERFYAKGRLEWLSWHGEMIRSTTQTIDMARFIADFDLVDVDGDGALEVVAAVVQKTRGMTTKGSSYLASFSIEQ
jgi:TolB-like protein